METGLQQANKSRARMADWGLQAFVDLALLRWMLRHVGHVVPHTFVPMLKHSVSDPDALMAEYAALKAEREVIRWGDSPREKWRKTYANFINELEWAFAHLRTLFPKAEFEELAIGVVGDAVAEWMQPLFPRIEAAMAVLRKERPGQSVERWNTVGLAGAQGLFGVVNMAGFLVGDVRIESLDVERGELLMEVPECGFLLARKDQASLPEESCMLACKGACERAFGDHAPVKMLFEPHLPDTRCTLRMSWK